MRHVLALAVGLSLLGAGTAASPATAEPPRARIQVDDVVTTLDGTYRAVFKLRRQGPIAEQLTLEVSTEDGPQKQSWTDGPYWAYANQDYVPLQQSLVFPRGVKELDVEVALAYGGYQYGAGQVFSLRVSSADADVPDPVADATIRNYGLATEDACHCFISGIKFYGVVPLTDCEWCGQRRGPRGLLVGLDDDRRQCLSLSRPTTTASSRRP